LLDLLASIHDVQNVSGSGDPARAQRKLSLYADIPIQNVLRAVAAFGTAADGGRYQEGTLRRT